MLTKNEITTLNLSPTKKDFVQIWNELLEVAGKLSERWDPTSTNESDPGIVILKALTGIADKLNYNIDKNTLEAFMPTAAQEDSMRKLCDMLGYNIKYYRSAETTATIKYYNSEPSDDEIEALESGLLIPKFTVLTNADQDISYFTVDSDVYPLPAYIFAEAPTVTVRCMEGQIVKCESTSDNNVITASQISENNRFYMPEATIAENGIFVYNVSTNMTDGTPWEKVDNLNIQSRGSRVFKFGYDSYEGRPYIEFPEDYSELIKDGLFIYYARTSGVNGNISARTLSQLELPSISGWDKVTADSFSVENTFSATTGSNVETISQSYNNFKKTIGTFETLVTCRDYMNKIYAMTSASTGKYLVSNILATDIRTDLNRAVTICSCDDAGIFYKDVPFEETKIISSAEKIVGSKTVVETIVEKEAAIDHFDLVFYPFKSYNQIRGNVKDIQEVYDASFSYSQQNLENIKAELDKYKTIAHNIISPRDNDILSINNYLRLNAIINTHSKITTEEGTLIKENIKIALANAFNMRELDFGEEIPFDSIVEVIENADPRIRVVSLAEPALYTTFSVLDGILDNTPIVHEYAVASDWLSVDSATTTGRFDYNETATPVNTFDSQKAKQIYNKLAVRNILAGRVPLFKYNETFKTSFSEGAYRVTEQIDFSQLPSLLQAEETNFVPTAANPFTIYTVNDVVYTGQLIEQAVDTITGDEPVEPVEPTTEVVYTKTYVPEKYKDNIITKELGNDITNIKTHCELTAELESNNGVTTSNIYDVTLAAGEVIKFRAPNFITTKTFPAYVNYHLNLDTDIVGEAEYAEAYTLFDLLNKYHNNRGAAPDDRRQSVLNYFSAAGKKKTFTLTQNVSKKVANAALTAAEDFSIFGINNSIIPDVASPEELLAISGFIKLVNHDAKVELVDAPAGTAIPELNIPEIDLGGTSFIVNSGVFTNMKQAIDEYLEYLNDNTPEVLPTDFDWTISYEFEYVPFNAETLSTWENFIKVNGRSLFGFTPEEANVEGKNTILWHLSTGGYNKGQYVLPNTSKLLGLVSGDIGLIEFSDSSTRLSGIYVAETLGKNSKSNYIKNDEEYELKANEYLCIEYTPSSTTSDGSTQSQEPVKEFFGPKTIIRPSGFENGLIDSTAYASEGHSAHKQVKFAVDSTPLPVFSLGASEQIEIRDFARVIINKDTFASSPSVYIYKNFNDCPELEDAPSYDRSGNRINNSYTLKDGEYIFYTDKNQAEFAYFTSGTEVTLLGDLSLSKFDKIDLTTIFDNGIQEIPWKEYVLTNSKGIMFQEFQYITLGANDTLKKLTLATNKGLLNENWQKCNNATYIPAGSTEELELQSITVEGTGAGNGWEACSMFELNVSPNNAQTLRKNEKVKTSIELMRENGAAVGITLDVGDDTADGELLSEPPLSFKVNLPCQSTSKELNIADLYTNPTNIKGFELKVFAEEIPAIVKTVPNSLIPYRETATAVIDMTSLDTTQKISVNEFGNLWKPVPLSSIAPVVGETISYDNALKLSASILPNTYGIFSIYVDYRKAAAADRQTWIEILPGASTADFELFNVETTAWTGNKLMLNPGINCIRINKTNTIYIKTKAVDGALYFDNIRLVDCKPIEYIKDGQKTTRATLGLNLDQLGYLDASDESTFNVFDKHIRQKLKNDFTTIALSNLDNLAQEELNKFNSAYNSLLTSKDKLQTLVTFVKQAKQEIEKLPADADNITALFEKYNEIANILDLEKNLQAALLANKDKTDLEAGLRNLLVELATAETTEQALLDELEVLKKLTLEKANIFDSALTDGAIEADFTAVADNNSAHLVNDLKLASIKYINETYAEELADIADGLPDADIEETIETSLREILDKVNIAKHADLLSQIDTLISANNSALSTDLTNLAITAAGTDGDVDYAKLSNDLISLRNKLSNSNVKELISQIEFIANSSISNSDKYISLELLINELKLLLDADATAVTGNYASLINSINAILVIVQSKPAEAAYDSDIYEDILALADEANTAYIDNIKSIITKITGILNSLNTEANSTILSLASAADAQVTAILGSLEDAINDRDGHLDKVTEFTINFNKSTIATDLPFGDDVVVDIWPKYMKRAFITGIDKLYKDVYTAITAPGSSATLNIDSSFYADAGKTEPRKVLIAQADISAFQRLFYNANNQIPENTKNSARTKLINDLYALILPTTAITSAMNNLQTAEDADINAVLCRIIAKLQASPTLIEKHSLLNELTTELDEVIKADTALLNISAKLLCPSILQFEDMFTGDANDAFYSVLKTAISNKKAELLAASSYSSTLATINTYLSGKYTSYKALIDAFNNDTIAEFTGFSTLLAPDAVSTTLLPTDFLNKLTTLYQTIEVRNSIAEIKDCRLFTILRNEDLVVAWQDTNGNWLDSSGNYYQKYISGKWKAYPSAGNADERTAWLTASAAWKNADDKWCTNDGILVTVDIKRIYIEKQGDVEATTLWVEPDAPDNYTTVDDYEDYIINIQNTNGDWFIDVPNEVTPGVFVEETRQVNTTIENILLALLEDTSELGSMTISSAFKDAYGTIILEEQLLAEIRNIDKNRNFYYSNPIEANVAIDFNVGDETSNTLMNPAINYDINNVNNNFVISKIDINYLTNGLQIARSSRLS